MQSTLVQRVVLSILNGVLFFVVALYPPYQMSTFVADSTVHYTFLSTVAAIMAIYFGVSKIFFKSA